MPAPVRTRHRYCSFDRSIFHLFGLVLFAAGAAHYSCALAADGSKLRDIEARYKTERTACESNRVGQDRAACLREAAAARDEALRGQLDETQPAYDKNALARCDALPAAERDICKRRTRGEGVTKGSVAGGGIYREYREITLPAVTPQNDARDKAGTGATGDKPQNQQGQQKPQR